MPPFDIGQPCVAVWREKRWGAASRFGEVSWEESGRNILAARQVAENDSVLGTWISPKESDSVLVDMVQIVRCNSCVFLRLEAGCLYHSKVVGF